MRYLPWKMLFHSISHLALPMLNGASNPAGPRARPLTSVIDIYIWWTMKVFHLHKPNMCSLITNYLRHKTPCGIRKLTAAFVSKRGVFSQFSWSLDFGTKLAEFPLPVPQIWWSQKCVVIQIQLMNIHVSECKYYCLHLVPQCGDVRDRQYWQLHQTA